LTLQPNFTLRPDDIDTKSWFGDSVALSGNTALVGASGSAYLFDVTTGQELVKLLPDSDEEVVYFGRSVALSGDTALVGALGSSYLFDATSGQQLGKLVADEGTLLPWAALSGNTALVGASGSAYLFDVTTGEQLFRLVPDGGAAGSYSGNPVALDGNTAVVYGSDSVYVFDATTGHQVATLRPNDDTTGASFGASGSTLAISGNIVVVGARTDNGNGTHSGSAYVFDLTTGEQLTKLTGSDGGGLLGWSVSISGKDILVGAPGAGGDSYLGAAYLFENVGTPGDFDGDSVLGTADIDLLSADIFAGTNDPTLDVTGDGAVDDADLTKWLTDAALHNGFSAAYLLGDSNLDGSVDAEDLNNLALSWQLVDTPSWSRGDFNVDGHIDVADLNTLALSWQQSMSLSSVANVAVPEPTAWLLLVIGIGLMCHGRSLL
jgi:hypothetical protein